MRSTARMRECVKPKPGALSERRAAKSQGQGQGLGPLSHDRQIIRGSARNQLFLAKCGSTSQNKRATARRLILLMLACNCENDEIARTAIGPRAAGCGRLGRSKILGGRSQSLCDLLTP